VPDCDTYLKLLRRLEEVAGDLGSKGLEDLMGFTLGDLVRVWEVSPRLAKFVIAVTLVIDEALKCAEGGVAGGG
jgi:hypothetical protein